MYPNNPNFLEKLAWSKVDDLQRRSKNIHNTEGKKSSKSQLLILTGLLVALAWMLSVVL